MTHRHETSNSKVPWTWHIPPVETLDPNTGLFFPAAATWDDGHGNVWALRWDIDAAGRGRNDPQFDANNLHALVVEAGDAEA
jgi:hypothetical protein